MDLPLEVKVIVYDLLPPSKLSSLLNFAGVGVYHTSVQLKIPLGPTDDRVDPTAQEWAFGGHDSPDVSGVFSIPAGSAPQRMPGLRMYTTIDMGTAFDHEAEHLDALLSSERDDSESAHDDHGTSDGTEYMTKSQRRAWRILHELKRDPSWNGTRYDLLKRNCNSFTEELVRRLTGRTPPYWINRAAFIATSFPCIVPAGLIDETEETVPTADTPSSPSTTIRNPVHSSVETGGIKIEPPRADRMDLGGRV